MFDVLHMITHIIILAAKVSYTIYVYFQIISFDLDAFPATKSCKDFHLSSIALLVKV